jgi:hypothetical protein
MIVIHEFNGKWERLRPISKYYYIIYMRSLRRTMKNLRVAGYQAKIRACELWICTGVITFILRDV